MISLVGLTPSLLLWITAGGVAILSMLYLLRLRRRQVVVPFLPLWQKVVKQSQYQSLWQRLKRLLSWLIQVALLLLLVFALSDPRLRAELLSGRQLVVVLDTSASMQATDERGSRFAQAKKKALDLISGLVGNDRMMLVQMDSEVIPLTPFTSDPQLLKKALEEVHVSESVADLRRALLLAKDALQGRPRGEIIVISDSAFGVEYKELLLHPPKSEDREPPPASKKPTPRVNPKPSDRTDREPPPKRTKKTEPEPRRKATKKRKPRARKRARPRKKARRGRRRSDRRKGKKGSKRKSPTALDEDKLPPGLKRRIDVTMFTGVSKAHRKLPRFRLVGVGKQRDNVGIVALSARRLTNHPLQFSVYTELRNFSKKPVAGLLEFYVDKLIIETIHISLKPEERWRHILPRLTAQGQQLEARLKITKGVDLLPADNRAYAVLPKARPVSVLLVSPDNLYLQAALLSDAQLIYRHVGCDQEHPKQTFDVIVYNQCTPKETPTEGRYVFIAPTPKNTPFRTRQRRGQQEWTKGPIITEVNRDHPIMRFVALRDLNIARTLQFQMDKDEQALASSFGKPLLVAKQTKLLRAVAMGFFLHETDMTLRVAFPLFLRNSIQWLMHGGRALPPTTRQTGRLWQISLPGNVRQVSIRDPKGNIIRLPVNQSQVLFSGRFSGFYKLTYQGGERLIAANLSDPEESSIQPQKLKPMHLRGSSKDTTKEEPAGISILGMRLPIPQPIWLYLLLLAAIIFGLEWYTYNRRITV